MGDNPAPVIHTNRDINMSPFTPGTDPDNTGLKWEKWKKELETRMRYFKITEEQDKIDAINIYGGEQIRELIDTLPEVAPPGGQNPTDFEKITMKLDHYFKPKANKDSARAVLDKMVQTEKETLAVPCACPSTSR